MLFGREEERELIARLLDGARRGTSGAIVIRGDPGVGKTALLDDAVTRAQDMTILRATGVESEAQLEFSGLLELTRPLLGDLGRLPPHQADVLRGALGFTENARDRFTVGAASLGLLASAAEERPVLVVVDDAQWLDEATMAALRFAARRLAADAVAFVFATRERDDGLSGAGFAEVQLAGLDLEASRRLLAEVHGDEVTSADAARIHEATAGHPLALVELPHEAAGSAAIEPLPVGDRIERAFASRVAALAAPERAALLVAAAVGTNELEPIVRALALRGLDGEALDRAEDERLVDLRADRFAFRHPLLRSVVYQRAASDERRDAHRAAAEVFDALGDVERRAWHLAAAAAGLDDAAAAALVDVAAAAQARGAHAAAAAAFERAGRLMSNAAERASRLADAADAFWSGGSERRALELADELLGVDIDPSLRARVLMLRGVFELQAGTQSRSRELLVEAADLMMERNDARPALGALSMAVFGCHAAGDVENSVALARRASDVAAALGDAERRGAAYVLGRSLLLAGESEEAARLLEPAIAGTLQAPAPSRAQLMQAAIACGLLEDDTRGPPLVARVLDVARREGPLPLMFACNLAADVDARAGRWQRAIGFAEEGLRLARDVNRPNVAAQFDSVLARVAAARGDEEAWRRHGEAAIESLRAAGMRLSYEQARSTYGLLCLGLDRLDEAVAVLGASATAVAEMAACDRDCSPEVDLVEALARLDRRPEGETRLGRWLERGVETTVWGPPLVARLRGLLAGEGTYEQHFHAALEAHVHWPQPFELARTRLLFGERLRRSGSRVAARAELRPALAAFVALGSETWAERARRELRASGQKLRAPDPESGDELTPQELQVATQVAEGKSNKEVAAALFLSPKTIEFHLGRIYRKLDVSSRTALARRVADGELQPTS